MSTPTHNPLEHCVLWSQQEKYGPCWGRITVQYVELGYDAYAADVCSGHYNLYAYGDMDGEYTPEPGSEPKPVDTGEYMTQLELKSRHLWTLTQKYTNNEAGPDDTDEAIHIPNWAVRAMLEDLQAMDTELDRLRQEVAQLKAQLAQAVSTYKEVSTVVLEEDKANQQRIAELEAQLEGTESMLNDWRDEARKWQRKGSELEAQLAEATDKLPSVDVLAAIEDVAHNNTVMGDRAFAVRRWLVLFDNQVRLATQEGSSDESHQLHVFVPDENTKWVSPHDDDYDSDYGG